jgi:LacI family transcriptional regulator
MKMDKEITMYDLAKQLKISIATVSRALQDDPVVSKKTKKRILELAEAMGYRSNHFARNLRQKQTNTIIVRSELIIRKSSLKKSKQLSKKN